jgi:hypothetical protein
MRDPPTIEITEVTKGTVPSVPCYFPATKYV